MYLSHATVLHRLLFFLKVESHEADNSRILYNKTKENLKP